MGEPTKADWRERPIRRVLRRKRSGEYFTGAGWSMNVEEARTFPDSLSAAQSCVHHCLSDMELVLRIHGGSADLYRTELS